MIWRILETRGFSWQVHMHIRTYVCMYIHTYVLVSCLRSYSHTYVRIMALFVLRIMYICMHLFPLFIGTYVRTLVHTYIHTYILALYRLSIYIRMCVFCPIYVHTYVWTYVCTYVCAYWLRCSPFCALKCLHLYNELHAYRYTRTHVEVFIYLCPYSLFAETWLLCEVCTYIHTYIRT